MTRAKISDIIELEYDSFGSPNDPALLLIIGFGAQMVAWETDFCNMLAAGGLHIIRFDNRDCGLSTHLDGVVVDTDDVIRAAMFEEPIPPVPYTLSDMTSDAVGLLDYLGIERAHVLGASMGGMIAQTFAIEYPQRTLSLTSVMSMTGELEYGQSTPEAIEALLTPPPTDREGYITFSLRWQAWHSKKYRSDELSYAAAARDYDRMFYPEGSSRQLAAIYASLSRAERLKNLNVPTLVVHGMDDTLIAPSGGQRTAELIPNARFLMLEDMGHDLPRPLWPTFVSAVHELTQSVTV
ncbi:MAG: alpha/beta fold hydrolase [Ilumatobacteraceae bacterium]